MLVVNKKTGADTGGYEQAVTNPKIYYTFCFDRHIAKCGVIFEDENSMIFRSLAYKIVW